MDAAGEILGKRACQDHPSTRLKHHLVSQNVLSKKAAPQMAASIGHFKLVGSPKQKSHRPRGGCSTRRQQLRVLVSHTEVSRLNHCLSMYTDPALASLDSTLLVIPLLYDERFGSVMSKSSFCKRREMNMTSFFSRRLVFLVVAVAIRVVLLL